MVKIISRTYVGQANVYDIGVENDHNFVIKYGFVAANCFNKSHSTAYAYVTYQTSYLKANDNTLLRITHTKIMLELCPNHGPTWGNS